MPSSMRVLTVPIEHPKPRDIALRVAGEVGEQQRFALGWRAGLEGGSEWSRRNAGPDVIVGTGSGIDLIELVRARAPGPRALLAPEPRQPCDV